MRRDFVSITSKPDDVTVYRHWRGQHENGRYVATLMSGVGAMPGNYLSAQQVEQFRKAKLEYDIEGEAA